MVLDFCTEGIIRLFAVILRFALTHWGWTIVFIIAVYLAAKLISKLGLKIFEFSGIMFIVYFPILIILMFSALILGFYIASWFSGAPVCSLVDEFSRWFI
ncbi:hypothetical protein HZA98_01710 [Candidatus Woesearchaeota archaeon]|nr:hypothetical protein [Candidatus Woesearchaeota archaeon]